MKINFYHFFGGGLKKPKSAYAAPENENFQKGGILLFKFAQKIYIFQPTCTEIHMGSVFLVPNGILYAVLSPKVFLVIFLGF